MEELADKPLTEYSIDEYDKLWKTAKKSTKLVQDFSDGFFGAAQAAKA